MSFMAANALFVQTCGDLNHADAVAVAALQAFAPLSLVDRPLSFRDRAEIIGHALTSKGFTSGGCDPMWMGELVNRAVFLDLPDAELIEYLETSNRAVAVRKRGDGFTASDRVGVDVRDPWNLYRYRGVRQQVLVQVLHFDLSCRSRVSFFNPDDLKEWSYQRMYACEAAQGTCFPCDMRVMGMVIGWCLFLQAEYNPVRFFVIPSHGTPYPPVLQTPEDVVVVNQKWYTADGFLRFGHGYALDDGGWLQVGMTGLCRDTVIVFGTYFCEMSGETTHGHKIRTWNQSRRPWSHSFSHYVSRRLTYGTKNPNLIAWEDEDEDEDDDKDDEDDDEDDEAVRVYEQPWWRRLPLLRLRFVWIAACYRVCASVPRD